MLHSTETQFASFAMHTATMQVWTLLPVWPNLFVFKQEQTFRHEHVDDVRFKQDELAARLGEKQKREIQCERNSVQQWSSEVRQGHGHTTGLNETSYTC